MSQERQNGTTAQVSATKILKKFIEGSQSASQACRSNSD